MTSGGWSQPKGCVCLSPSSGMAMSHVAPASQPEQSRRRTGSCPTLDTNSAGLRRHPFRNVWQFLFVLLVFIGVACTAKFAHQPCLWLQTQSRSAMRAATSSNKNQVSPGGPAGSKVRNRKIVASCTSRGRCAHQVLAAWQQTPYDWRGVAQFRKFSGKGFQSHAPPAVPACWAPATPGNAIEPITTARAPVQTCWRCECRVAQAANAGQDLQRPLGPPRRR